MLIDIPPTTKNIPERAIKLMVSPNKNQLIMAANGGTRVMINIEIRAPIMANEANKNISPNTNPMIPESESQIHACLLASIGRTKPRLKYEKAASKTNANPRRIIFNEYVPTFLAAISNDKAVIVQNIAVNKAANSP